MPYMILDYLKFHCNHVSVSVVVGITRNDVSAQYNTNRAVSEYQEHNGNAKRPQEYYHKKYLEK